MVRRRGQDAFHELLGLGVAVVGADAAPWLFDRTTLTNGRRFGNYGIEIDQRTAASPAGLARMQPSPAPQGSDSVNATMRAATESVVQGDRMSPASTCCCGW